MEIMDSYRSFSEQIDQCGDMEQLQAYKKDNTPIAMRNEFWKQRRIALAAEDPLEKQKALAKTDWIQKYFGCRVPVLRSVNQFLAPDGLFGIFISSKAVLGTDCVIFPHVFISSNTLPDSPNAGFPIIGNNVYIGAGAKIIGNVIIGDHARIEPNCCVTADVPANSIVSHTAPRVTVSETPLVNSHLQINQYLDRRFGTVIYDYDDHTADAELRCRKAAAGDIDTIVGLYKDRMAWFRWKKISQWGHYLLSHPRALFLREIQKGAYYVVERGAEVIAGFVLMDDSKEWQDDDANAYYLRMVVSHPGYKNIGKLIVSEAKRITRAEGKDFLRLECVYANEQLNAIWEKHGFAFVRDVEDSYHCSLREWPAAD